MGAVRHLPPVAAGMWRCREPPTLSVVSERTTLLKDTFRYEGLEES